MSPLYQGRDFFPISLWVRKNFDGEKEITGMLWWGISLQNPTREPPMLCTHCSGSTGKSPPPAGNGLMASRFFAFCCTFVLDKTADASTNCLFPCCGDGMEQCTLLVLHRGSRPCNRDRSSGRAARAGAQPTSKLQKLGSTFTADPCKARHQPCWAKTCCLHNSC